jgi:hypothetical protein
MAQPNNPIASTGDGYFGELENGVVGCGKAPVGRELRNLCILKISVYDLSEVVYFLPACLMRSHALCGE